jgi:hypothetical protein
MNSRIVMTCLLCVALFSSAGIAQDLGKYRDFEFGMSLQSVAEKIKQNPANAKTAHQRPALVQTLEWDQFRYSDSAGKATSLRSIRFDFYNGELSKILVTYDPAGTEGLTTADMIEAISAIYGPAAKPERTVTVSPPAGYEDNQEVLALWEDSQYSFNLFRSVYGNAFGLVAFSKKLDLLATESSREAARIEKLEAPGKELARQLKQEAEKRAAEEKARLISKPKFHP